MQREVQFVMQHVIRVDTDQLYVCMYDYMAVSTAGIPSGALHHALHTLSALRETSESGRPKEAGKMEGISHTREECFSRDACMQRCCLQQTSIGNVIVEPHQREFEQQQSQDCAPGPNQIVD